MAFIELDIAEMIQTLDKLQQETPAKWGTLSAQGMVEHLCDGLKMASGKLKFPLEIAPDKIEKIILLSPAIDPETEKFWWFSKLGKVFLVRWFLPERMNTATDEKYAHVKELKILKNDWKNIQSDVTVMAGGKDWIVDTTNFSFAKKMLIGKNAKFIFIPESGHLISSSRPDLVKKEIFK